MRSGWPLEKPRVHEKVARSDCLGRTIHTQAADAAGAEIIAETIRAAGLDAAVDQDHSLPNYVSVSIPTMHEMVAAYEREALTDYAAAIWDMERETAEPEAEAAF